MIGEKHWKGKSLEELVQEDDFFRLTLQTERETAFAEGYAEGFAEGYAEGYAEGWAEFRELNRAGSARAFAIRLIQGNIPDNNIQRYTKLSLDEIASLKVQVQNQKQ